MVTRIVAFRTHESNYNSGTEIDLDNGEQILVGNYPEEVEKEIKVALRELNNES